MKGDSMNYCSHRCGQIPEKKQLQGGRLYLSSHSEDAVHLCGEDTVMGAALSCGGRSVGLLAHI